MKNGINNGIEMSEEEKDDYLHFLSSAGNHNSVGIILDSENTTNEEKLTSIMHWFNHCVDWTNHLNEKHGFKFYDEDFLDKHVKMCINNGNFRCGSLEQSPYRGIRC